ncbi:type IX secretion system membrane protein PorP/SprF [Lacinutrix sp. C3R15]|uniref:PorP/SprF family type IX secretion system membrane protein n=1 Tax=Flavobacteriaceae TaxID=49546 RepID=UPI001C09CDCD|nr:MULTISPECIES: type IX secretion system membrane protein PorP/SprF [Flavobacteriaceae]MBU2940046.1 type IX secretion system membrane protein PorP/SprF [Lacinutrix sp. C3R15]MDO6623363.1 type IX secretion system membrane protein PorP/SprF [Oceanihabitans sp. 1_MG-2023]
MNLKKLYLLAVVVFCSQFVNAQEGLPIYTDYLTDNYYLIHPSMAGAANCAKLRVTGRQQWFGQEDAPQLATISVNSRIGDTPSAIGAIVYSDKNGYHSQNGVYLTYAHHLMFSRNEIDLNQLSFGLSVGMIQYKLDETAFLNEPFDPLIYGIEQSSTNFNIDLGFSYNLYNFYAHATVKNVLNNDGINNDVEITSNLRRYLFSAGYGFGKFGSDWSYEPSILFQYKDGTKEASFDLNFKTYKKMEFGQIWGGLSYRRSLDGAEYIDGSSINSQKAQYISPILGINYNNFMFAYTYAYQANSVVFNNAGFHQITLGLNFNCRKEKYHCNCPAVN